MRSDQLDSAYLMSAIKVENLSQTSDCDRPFYEGEGKQVQLIGHAQQEGEPVFLFQIGKQHRLSITLLHKRNAEVTIKRILGVKALPVDGRNVELEIWQSTTDENKCQAMALLDPLKTGCEPLVAQFPCDVRDENCVPLDLVIAVSIFHDGTQAIELNHRIHCRVTDSSQKFKGWKFNRKHPKAWEENPFWVNESVAASVVCWKIIMDL